MVDNMLKEEMFQKPQEERKEKQMIEQTQKPASTLSYA
jgi:hypothetical protein